MSLEAAEAGLRPAAPRRGDRRPAARPAAGRPAPHARGRAVSVEQRLAHLRDLLAPRHASRSTRPSAGADRMTEAVTLFALLELYKAGEATGSRRSRSARSRSGPRREPRERPGAAPSRRCCSCRAEPVPVARPGRRLRGAPRARSSRRSRACASTTPRASAASCCARSPAASRSPPTRSPSAPRGACSPSRARRRSPRRRPSASRSSPTCSRSRGPEIARIRGVSVRVRGRRRCSSAG